MHYVIGDIHGSFDALMMLLEKIEDKDSDAQIIFVGDFIDRGEQSLKTLRWVMEKVTSDGKYQSVKGNHEDMLYNHLLHRAEDPYETPKILDDEGVSSKEKIQICEFIKGLPYYKKIEITSSAGIKVTYVIVHANYSSIAYEEGSKEFNHECIWGRNFWGHSYNDPNDFIVVHGHTPTLSSDYRLRGSHTDRPGMICYRSNTINVDGGCSYYPFNGFVCQLCAICLETLEEVYAFDFKERLYDVAMEEYKSYPLLEKIPEEERAEVIVELILERHYLELQKSVYREQLEQRLGLEKTNLLDVLMVQK